MSQYSTAMAAIRRSYAPRYGVGGCDKRGRAHDTVHSARSARARSRYKFCIVTERGLRHGFVSRYNERHGRGGLRYDAQQHARAHGDTALRHDRVCAATRLGQTCDTDRPGL